MEVSHQEALIFPAGPGPRAQGQVHAGKCAFLHMGSARQVWLHLMRSPFKLHVDRVLGVTHLLFRAFVEVTAVLLFLSRLFRCSFVNWQPQFVLIPFSSLSVFICQPRALSHPDFCLSLC